MSNVKVFAMIAGLTALFLVLGRLLGGTSGMWIALVLAAGLNLVAYYASADIALRAYRGRRVSRAEAPQLYALVERLSKEAGLPMPALAISPQQQPNAFAAGRNARHAVVCVTEGALGLLDTDEMEGVLAHELAHVRNRDMLLMTFTATLAGAIGYLANIGFFLGAGRDRRNPIASLLVLIFAPLAAMLIQLAVGRQREFKADATGAGITGRPLELARALRDLDAAAHQVPMRIPPTMALLAQVDPLAAQGRGFSRLFSTHPPIQERIARLEALAQADRSARAA
jgi:heat shock protein HtpX